MLTVVSAALIGLTSSVAVPAYAGNMIAVQPDGKIVLAGSSTGQQGAIVRLEPDGSIDLGFGAGGAVVTSNPIQAVALQSDGKIVVAEHGALIRYEADGSRDLDFGSKGIAIYKPGLGLVTSMVVLSDGRIAVGGYLELETDFFHGGFVLVFSADGSQEAIGELGALTDVADLAQQPDGSLILGGSGMRPSDSRGWGGLLARFVPGSNPPLDPSFGEADGLTIFSFPGAERGASKVSAVTATDGGILAAGEAGGNAELARFDDRGQLDTSFGQSGFAAAVTDPGLDAAVRDVAVQPNGGVLVGGSVSTANQVGCGICPSPFVARFQSSGIQDTVFGKAGFASLLDADGSPVVATGESLALLPGGSALIAGNTTDGWNGFVVGRLFPNGAINRSFGDAGTAKVYVCDDGRIEPDSVACVPRARVRLRVDQLVRGRPSLHLHVGSSAGWMAIRSVQLRLPRALRFRRRHPALRADFIDSVGRDQLRRPKIRDRSLVSGPHRWDVGSMGLKVPAGILVRVGKVTPRRRLPFRIAVWFAATRHISVRQDFVLRCSG